MAKSSVKKAKRRDDMNPRLTPLRAFDLLRECDYRSGVRAGERLNAESALERTRQVLCDHVKNALRRAGSR